jgi:hypothetical protein
VCAGAPEESVEVKGVGWEEEEQTDILYEAVLQCQ